MKNRNSYTNELVFKNLDKSVKMIIDSKCPDKWIFVDLETGDIWHYSLEMSEFQQNSYKIKRVSKEKVNELQSILIDRNELSTINSLSPLIVKAKEVDELMAENKKLKALLRRLRFEFLSFSIRLNSNNGKDIAENCIEIIDDILINKISGNN